MKIKNKTEARLVIAWLIIGSLKRIYNWQDVPEITEDFTHIQSCSFDHNLKIIASYILYKGKRRLDFIYFIDFNEKSILFSRRGLFLFRAYLIKGDGVKRHYSFIEKLCKVLIEKDDMFRRHYLQYYDLFSGQYEGS